MLDNLSCRKGESWWINLTRMEKIFYKNILVGIRIKTFVFGSTPITGKDESLQVLTHKHKKGMQIKPHIHISKKRTTMNLQECVVVKRGKIRINLFAPNKNRELFKRINLGARDVFILMNGGQSIDILEDTEMIEAKNGPFKDDKIFI